VPGRQSGTGQLLRQTQHDKVDIDLTLSPAAVFGNRRAQITGEEAREHFEDSAPGTSFVGSSWDLLRGLDVAESEPGELFDEFFDSDSGAAREFGACTELSKDQWLLAFLVHRSVVRTTGLVQLARRCVF
jgi:hypothetical protein